MIEKPVVEPHVGEAPTELIIEDIVVGEGDEVVDGATIVVHYVGVGALSGEELDSSWAIDEPFEFPVGYGRVISGWDLGVLGMQTGGRRRLVVPAKLAYGDIGVPGIIEPNEAILFVVDLIEIKPSTDATTEPSDESFDESSNES